MSGIGPDRAARDIKAWEDVKLLTVAVDRLERWHRPGFLAIGDAAHAMSPVGGVGINLAIQDAVATANRLAGPLRAGQVNEEALAQVQKRRMLAVRATQAAQIFIQNRVIAPTLGGKAALKPPLAFRLVARFAFLRRLVGRAIGMGLRPEHIQPSRF